MIKALAVVRTIFLVFIIGYTVRAMPFFWSNVAKTFDEQYARCAEGLGLTLRAAWVAIAWIAVETALGWYLATRRPRAPKEAPPPGIPPGEPPFAPPPRG
ncbi:MAG TPA: hypothetical protein VLS93_04295 [Anaeromyxobacteraceae bacterium]|nr:hypothetical protein [Anaeromyxobacteraceae bacterium]